MIKRFSFNNFKSFEHADLYTENFTTLIGTNASGKSNAIEGMRILSELVSGLDISIILDGSRNTNTGIRGGSKGCCRFKSTYFQLGCTVILNEEFDLQYDIRIGVGTRINVLEESLYKISKKDSSEVKIYNTKPPASKESGDIKVEYNNGKRGMNPEISCIRSSAVLPQLKAKMPSDTKVYNDKNTFKDNLKCIDTVINNLTHILFLDPIPSDMRDYVRASDTELKPNGENVSAVLKQLCSDSDKKDQFLKIIQSLPENEIVDITFIETSLGDVIFALKEKYGDISEEVDAKRLSDGTLRCIAIVTAVITGAENSMVVVEEIDNGIHPGRAKGLIDNISCIGREQKIDMLITTHNATLLNGLSKDNLMGVSVAYRDEKTGSSRFQSFIDVGDYPKLLAMGGLGDSIVNDTLIEAIKHPNTTNRDMSWLEVSE